VHLPDLTRVAETFIRLGPPDEPHNWRHLESLRLEVAPLVADLTERRLILWYSFLVHDRGNGVPAPFGDNDHFWHVRLEMAEGVDLPGLMATLPESCEMTQAADPAILGAMSIPAVELLNLGVAQAWLLLGEQCEWLLHVIDSYRADAPIAQLLPPLNAYLHYAANMTQMEVRLR
jgi:hypothetical protein